MKIILFTLIIILASLNIFCSVLYSKIITRMPGQLKGRITLNKLNVIFNNAANDEEKNLITKCRRAYTTYLVFFYVLLGVLIFLIVGLVRR